MNKIAWIFNTVIHPRKAQEFTLACQVILPIMSDPQETREKKRETLCMMVNELSEKTFRLKPIAEHIMGIINMKEDVCREYPSSESQVEGILTWLPRMKGHRSILLEEVKRHRRAYGFRE